MPKIQTPCLNFGHLPVKFKSVFLHRKNNLKELLVDFFSYTIYRLSVYCLVCNSRIPNLGHTALANNEISFNSPSKEILQKQIKIIIFKNNLIWGKKLLTRIKCRYNFCKERKLKNHIIKRRNIIWTYSNYTVMQSDRNSSKTDTNHGL